MVGNMKEILKTVKRMVKVLSCGPMETSTLAVGNQISNMVSAYIIMRRKITRSKESGSMERDSNGFND
jgi:hypothetical protein